MCKIGVFVYEKRAIVCKMGNHVQDRVIVCEIIKVLKYTPETGHFELLGTRFLDSLFARLPNAGQRIVYEAALSIMGL